MKKNLIIFLLAVFSITLLFAQSKNWTDAELSKYGIGKEKGNDGNDHLVYDKVETLEVGKTYKWLNTSGKSEPSIDKNSGSYGFGLYEVMNGKQNSYPSATLWVSSKDAKSLYGQTKVWNGFEELGFKQTWSNQTWGWGTRDENIGEWVSIRFFNYGLAKIYTDEEYAKYGIGKEKGNDGNEYLVYDKVEKLEKGKTYKWLNSNKGSEPELAQNENHTYRFCLFEVGKGNMNSYPTAMLYVTTKNAEKLYGQTKKWNGFEELELSVSWENQNWGWSSRDENTGEWVGHRYIFYSLNRMVPDKELAKYGVARKRSGSGFCYAYDGLDGKLEVGKTYRWLNPNGGTKPEKNEDDYYVFKLFEVEKGKIKETNAPIFSVVSIYPDEDIGLYGKDIKWNGINDLEKLKLTEISSAAYRKTFGETKFNEELGVEVGYIAWRYEFFYNSIKSLEDMIKRYAGYDEIVKKGFDIKSLKNVKTAEDLHAVLKPYVVDHHFTINGTDGFLRSKEIVFLDEYAKKVDAKDILNDENYLKYPDREDWYGWYPLKNSYRKLNLKVQKTNNTYPKITKEYYTKVYDDLVYIYINSLYAPFVTGKFTSMLDNCKNRKYVVIDLRNTSGGQSEEQRAFFKQLQDWEYKGTIYMIVNKNSRSAAEFIVPLARNFRKLDVQVVGENTTGAMNFVDPTKMTYNGIYLSLPLTRTDTEYEEGVGVMPDIYSMDDDVLATMKLLTGVTLPFDKL